jgi:hypothetical protein
MTRMQITILADVETAEGHPLIEAWEVQKWFEENIIPDLVDRMNLSSERAVSFWFHFPEVEVTE